MKWKLSIVSLFTFLLLAVSATIKTARAGGDCVVLCNWCSTVQCLGGFLNSCTPEGGVAYTCEGTAGLTDSLQIEAAFRTNVAGLLQIACTGGVDPGTIGCNSSPTCKRPCVPATTTSLLCNASCRLPGVADPNPCASPNECKRLTMAPCTPPDCWGNCRHPLNITDLTCTPPGGGQPDNTCIVTCDPSHIPPCGAVTKQNCVGTCQGFSDGGYTALILTRISGMPDPPPDKCTRTGTSYTCTDTCTTVAPPTGVTGGECKKEARSGPPAGDYWKKINCSGRCLGPSGGAPTAGSCIACGAPNVDFGVCAVQPNGEIFDSCCPGSVAQRDGAGCTCLPTKDAVYRLFDLINGVMLPVVIILGIFLIVVKGYKIMMSQGDPTALQEGKEGLTSAIIGLIFVLMAVSILRVIIKALISGDSSPF